MEVGATLAMVLDFDIDFGAARRHLCVVLSGFEPTADVRFSRDFICQVYLSYDDVAA
jgi:hypothetical protein